MQAAVINCGGLRSDKPSEPRCLRPTRNCSGWKNSLSLFSQRPNPLANKELSKQTLRVSELPGQLAAAPSSSETRYMRAPVQVQGHVRVHTWRGTQAKVFFCLCQLWCCALFRLDLLNLWLFSIITGSLIDLIVSEPLSKHGFLSTLATCLVCFLEFHVLEADFKYNLVPKL